MKYLRRTTFNLNKIYLKRNFNVLGNGLQKFSFFKINNKSFSEEIRSNDLNGDYEVTKHNEKLSTIISREELHLSKLSFNILKFLENNNDIYTRLTEDSIKLSYELCSIDATTDILKNELMRINKQINKLSKQNNYYEEFHNLLYEMHSNLILAKEAEQIGEEELRKSALIENISLRKKLLMFQEEIIEYLIPDTSEGINVINMEIKAAAGGLEGAFFAGDLVNMYKKYCHNVGFNFQVISNSTVEYDGVIGCKNGVFKISGENAYKYFKYESGVHKVQRVPVTESKGRIHSSTCQVAIFADKEFSFDDLDESDLRIDYMRASGAGGQHVNRTESAVRITHIPSGIVVQNQDERDQHRNKAKAMEVLKQRLYNKQISSFNSEVNDSRRAQNGSGNLSEKIRTYNWHDSRITDHKLGISLYGIDKMLDGIHLETILDKHVENEKIERLNEIIKKLENI